MEVNSPVDSSNIRDNWCVVKQKMLMCLEVGRYHVLGTAVPAKNAAKNRAEPFDDYSEHIVSVTEWSSSKK